MNAVVNAVVSAEQLRWASPNSWAAAAAAAGDLSHRVGLGAARISGLLAALHVGWGGAAAGAAARRLTALRDGLQAHALILVAVDQALAEHATSLTRARAVLSAAASGEGIRTALHLAARAEARTAGRLAALSARCAATIADPVPRLPATLDPPRTDPATVRAWWAGLSEAQRRWMIQHRPEFTGSLDGVPAAARDQANRLLLTRLPRADLGELRDWLGRAGRPRAYLLRLDADAGRAVVSIGDPDLADHVLVHVPGAGSTVDGIGTDLARAERVLARCAGLDPGEAVAAVVWLDYDVPESVGAVRSAYAHDAGADLRRFVDGLRAAHLGTDPTHLTVLGHSYGSLVVGATARDHGLAADDVVFVGSPGVGVAHVDRLRLPAEHVWSTTARQDPIQHVAPSLAQAAGDVVRSMALPGYAGIALAQPDEDLWHGHNPSRPEFGGRVFTSAADTPVRAAHTAYWEAGNVALDNIARITLGGGHHAAVR